MAKKGLEKSLGAQLFDQFLHALGASFVLLGIALLPSPWDGALVGFSLWLLREATEEGSVLSSGSLVDLSGWIVGGIGTRLALDYSGLAL